MNECLRITRQHGVSLIQWFLEFNTRAFRYLLRPLIESGALHAKCSLPIRCNFSQCWLIASFDSEYLECTFGRFTSELSNFMLFSLLPEKRPRAVYRPIGTSPDWNCFDNLCLLRDFYWKLSSQSLSFYWGLKTIYIPCNRYSMDLMIRALRLTDDRDKLSRFLVTAAAANPFN